MTAGPAGSAPNALRPAGRVTRWSRTTLGDRIFALITTLCALAVPTLLAIVAVEVAVAAAPALRSTGLSFVTTSVWDPSRGQFGALGAAVGTIVTSVLAVLLAGPLALGVALFLTDFATERVRTVVGYLVDLLAAIPSIVYGLWGLFVLVPLLRTDVMPAIQALPFIGQWRLFQGPAYGTSLLAGALVLAIMILPYIAAVAREVLAAVPRAQREAALGLGATRWEMVRDAVLPWARPGIIGGVVLGLGRALGETMAVTMVVGNRHDLPSSLFAPGYTMASLIANEFSEASGDLHLSALMAVGALLLIVTVIANAIARLLVGRVAVPGVR